MRDSEYNANEYMATRVQNMSGSTESRRAPVSECRRALDSARPVLTAPSGAEQGESIAGVAPGPLTLQDWWRTSALRGAGTVIDASIAERYERARQARIDRGEECEKCGGRDIERQEFCGVFVCRCGECWFDLKGAE